MSHLYKMTKWQGASGRWYANDTTDLVSNSAKWYAPARLLRIPLTDYIELLRNTYSATIVKYSPEKDYLHFYWEKESDANRFVLWINKQSKANQWIV